MKNQGLSPTMEYGKDADCSSQMFRIGSDGSQGLGGGPKQDVVDDLLVLVSDGSDLVPNPAELEGISTNPYSGGPFVMWKGTPYVRIMVPVGKRPEAKR